MLRYAVPIIALLLPVATSAAEFGEPVEVLKNGGFEQGLEHWRPMPGHSLVDDKKVARSGERCAMGEATGPNQALKLIQEVPVREGDLYEFSCWAKATNRAKLVLFGTFPGEKQRRSIAVFENVPNRWTRYETLVDAPKQDGVLQLEVICPSTFNAPPGKMWVDDCSLLETDMPKIVELCPEDEGYQDDPTASVSPEGVVKIKWNSHRDGAEERVAVEVEPSDTGLRIQELDSRSEVIFGYGDIVSVCVGPPEDIGSHFLAMESSSASGIEDDSACRWIVGGDYDSHGPISPMTFNSYDPAIAARSDGDVCIAYHSFRDGNYDIYLQEVPRDQEERKHTDWTPERRLTTAPTIDRHAELITSGDDLYLVYENATCGGYHIGSTVKRHLIVARVDDDGLKTVGGPCPLADQSEAACPAIDDHDRLWIAYRKIRGRHQGWATWLTSLDLKTGDWTRPLPVTTSKGPDRKPALAIADDRAYVVSVCDDFPGRYPDREASYDSKSRLYLATVDLPPVDPDREETIEWIPLVENDEPFPPAAIREEMGEDLSRQSTEYNGRELKLYWGDLHEHSEISICNQEGDGSLDESYQAMRDIARYDFACITDHGYNMNPYRWHYSAKWALANDDPGRFVPLLGFEWTSTIEEYSDEHPEGFYGHRNLIFADLDFPRWWNAFNRDKPDEVWRQLREMDANFVHIPHQLADTGNVPMDHTFHDETAQPVAEIFQTRGSYEYFDAPRMANRTTGEPGCFYQDLLADGLVIGVIAAPDHGGGYGKAAVWAEDLTRESILDAIRARRCYGTTTAKIALDVRIDGHMMGEKVAASPDGPVDATIRVLAPQEIKEVALCRNNEYIKTLDPDGQEAEITFTDDAPLDGVSWYYVRVILENDEIAWTSPVWFGKE